MRFNWIKPTFTYDYEKFIYEITLNKIRSSS